MKPHGGLELRHEAEVARRDRGQFLRGGPLLVRTGKFPERLPGLRIDRPVGYEELLVERGASLADKRVHGASHPVRGGVLRRDLARHLLAVESRTMPEVAKQVAGEVFPRPCLFVIGFRRNVGEERIVLNRLHVFLSVSFAGVTPDAVVIHSGRGVTERLFQEFSAFLNTGTSDGRICWRIFHSGTPTTFAMST